MADTESTPLLSESPAALTNNDPIAIAEPPWTLTGDFYTICHWVSASQATNFPQIAHSPLEAASEFGNVASSRPVGGVALIQIIRYHQSPVGPYDELAITPGKFAWSKDVPDGERITGQNFKISRMYVSQKHTCYNGRNNWNIPKHLARFDWQENSDSSTTVRVYPHDTELDETEASASEAPFFQATLKQIPYLPNFPSSTDWLNYVGLSTKFVQPPLPHGNGSQGELPGTDCWRTMSPTIFGNTSALVTVNMSQRNEDGELVGEHENFWPGMGKWQVGMKVTNGTMEIGAPDEAW